MTEKSEDAKNDLYAALGVEREATQEQIRHAFQQLSKQFHPDREGGDEKRMREISEAWTVLKDPEKRLQYDAVGQDAFSSISELALASLDSVIQAVAGNDMLVDTPLISARKAVEMAFDGANEELRMVGERRKRLRRQRKMVRARGTGKGDPFRVAFDKLIREADVRRASLRHQIAILTEVTRMLFHDFDELFVSPDDIDDDVLMLTQ